MRLPVATALAVLLLACTEPVKHQRTRIEDRDTVATDIPRNHRVDTIVTKLGLSTGSCEGWCPVQAFQIDSAGVLYYFGGLHAEPKGCYTGVIPPAAHNELVRLAKAVETIGIPPFRLISEDSPQYELVFVRGADTVRAEGCHRLLGEAIYSKLDSMLRILKQPELHRVDEKLELITVTPRQWEHDL